MNDPQQLLSALGKPFQKEAIKSRVGGGGSRFDYVAGFTVIHRLNDATGGVWDWEIKSFDFRPLPPDKYGKEQSLVVVTGELTIPGLGTRAGIGVQKVSENGGEDLVKGASTDALKKAATLFGVALELYGDDYEDETRAPAQQPQRQQPQRGKPEPYHEMHFVESTARPASPAAPASGNTFVKYNDPGHTAIYEPQKAVREELAARKAAAPASAAMPVHGLATAIAQERQAPSAQPAARLDTDQVLAILGEMDDSREPWHEIKRYADDQSATREDEDDVLRIYDKLKAIAKGRKAAAPAQTA